MGIGVKGVQPGRTDKWGKERRVEIRGRSSPNKKVQISHELGGKTEKERAKAKADRAGWEYCMGPCGSVVMRIKLKQKAETRARQQQDPRTKRVMIRTRPSSDQGLKRRRK